MEDSNNCPHTDDTARSTGMSRGFVDLLNFLALAGGGTSVPGVTVSAQSTMAN